jgi:hypothetical protein
VKADVPVVWLGEYRVDGDVVSRIGRKGDELVAEFSSLGTFRASRNGIVSHLEPLPGAPSWAFQKLRASLFDALLRHVQGKVTFHGSAVASGPRAVAFVGSGGAGKSTLAAACCARSELELVADDTVAFEIATGEGEDVGIVPTQKVAWLLPDARAALGLDAGAKTKVPLSLRSAQESKVSLLAIVGLSFDADVAGAELLRLRGQDAFQMLSRSTIRFVIDEPAVQVREFEQLQYLIERCPVFELRRNRDLGQLERTVELVRDLFTRPFGEERKA